MKDENEKTFVFCHECDRKWTIGERNTVKFIHGRKGMNEHNVVFGHDDVGIIGPLYTY